MSPRKTFATAGRVLQQLRHDPRTIGMIIMVPIILMVLLRYIFDGQPQIYNTAAPVLLGIFPLFIMFLITSITTLRERTSGTLDRLMTQPISKLDLVFGYAAAFSVVGFVQATVVSFIAFQFLDITIAGSVLVAILVAVLAAFLGTSLGLLVSAFARNEFQAVQLVMPTLMPQILLSGLFIPREHMAGLLETISNFLPLTYSVEAMQIVSRQSDITTELIQDLLIILGCGILALILGTITVKRQE